MNINKFTSGIKKAWRKFKYLDRTQLNYYVVTGFISTFCVFTGLSYAAFNLTNYANVGNITIAKLAYNLSIDSCESCTKNDSTGDAYPYVDVAPNTIGYVNMTLTSLNHNYANSTRAFDTKYAINYSKVNTGIQTFTSGEDVSVYYSTNNPNNMQGTVASYDAGGAITPIRIVVTNNSSATKRVYFTVDGGYLQNTVESNITAGYAEADLIIRTKLLDQNFNYKNQLDGFPTNTSSQTYAYYKTVCDNENAIVTYNSTNNTVSIESDGPTTCEVYYKEMCNSSTGECTDIEVVYNLKQLDGTETTSTASPGQNYNYVSGTCSGGAAIGTPTWNSTKNAWELNITNITSTNLCVAYFEEKKTIACVDESGNDMDCPSTLAIGQRMRIGDQYFRYIRTTNTSDTTHTYNECQDGGAASIACTDADSRHPLANNQLRLLAEYNLNVGSNKNNSVTEGIQHETVRGYRVDGGTKYGNIAYGSSNNNYSQSNVKTYTDNYASYLNTTYFGGSNEVSGSAITLEELRMLGCNPSSNTCSEAPSWVYTSSYWLGSPYNDTSVWGVSSDANLYTSNYSNNPGYGMRPVISISASSI